MSHQDWESVTWDKRGKKGLNESKKDFLKREAKNGRNIVEKRYKGSGMGKLEEKMNKAEEEGNLKHKKLSGSICKRIAQRRMEMKMSQVDLARKLNVQVNVIKEYEKPGSKVIPSARLLNKIEKILGRVRD